MKNINNGKLRSPKEISEMSGAHEQFVYYCIKVHKLAHYRVGKRIFIREDDWTTFLEARREEAVDG